MLYIGIPAYNEATTIGVLLWRLRSVLAEVSREYEVVVYDDASTDQTAETLAPYSRVLPLTVIRGPQRLGYAGATDALVRHVARTTRYPRRDALLLLQGDFTDPPALVPEFLRRFEGGADLVIGERVSSGDAPTSVRRLWQASRWVLRPFVGISDVRDLTTSFRLVRIAVLRDLIKAAGDTPIVSGEAWSANADFLLRTAPHARRVETIPVTPTFTVRTRETRRTAWPDALALAKWGWSRRGQRVAAKVIARAIDSVEADDASAPETAERGNQERRERPVRERTSRERPPRETTTREAPPTREKTPRVAREESSARADASPAAAATDREQPSVALDGESATRPARKRRKRGAQRDRADRERSNTDVAPPNGGQPFIDDAETTSDHDTSVADQSDGDVQTADASDGGEASAGSSAGSPARRKRSRRGRRRRGEGRADATSDAVSDDGEGDVSSPDSPTSSNDFEAGDSEPGNNGGVMSESDEAARKRRRSRRGRRGGSRKRTNGSPGEGEPRDGGAGDGSGPSEGA